jgi:hypothetical protein
MIVNLAANTDVAMLTPNTLGLAEFGYAQQLAT